MRTTVATAARVVHVPSTTPPQVRPLNMISRIDRRLFLQGTAVAAAGLAVARNGFAQETKKTEKLYDISLAQWSLNREFFAFLGNNRGGSDVEKLDPKDFAVIAKEKFGIEAVEYVNQFYREAYDNQLI